MEELKIASSFSQIGCKKTYLWLACENASDGVFQQKKLRFLEKKLLTQKCYTKTLTKTYKILKNIFGFDYQAIEYTHLYTYNYINEINIHWTLNMCVMCVDQVWSNP